MKMPLNRAAGLALLVNVGLELLGIVIGIILLMLNVKLGNQSNLIAALIDLCLLVVVYVLIVQLAPHEGIRAWFRGAMGGLGAIIHLCVHIALGLGLVAKTATVEIMIAADFAFGFWLLWVNWQMWRNALLKGTLPWFGVVYGLVYLAVGWFSPEPKSAAAVLLILINIPLLFVWKTWLGIRLYRGPLSPYVS